MVVEDIELHTVTLARDRMGVRPLFYVSHSPHFFAVASTPAPLQVMLQRELNEGTAKASPRVSHLHIQELRPDQLLRLDLADMRVALRPSPLALPRPHSAQVWTDAELAPATLRLLRAAVAKRLDSNLERPVCCLLSGGIDSSAVAALLADDMRRRWGHRGHAKDAIAPRLATFAIGFPGSDDLRYARVVADAIGADHHEVLMGEDEALRALPEVVRATGTYDITTIRASTPMYLMCCHIARHTNYRVVFSGEGSDELNAGYLYFHQAPSRRTRSVC